MSKFRRVSSYKINEKDRLGRYTTEEVIYYNPNLDLIISLLEEGPCKVIFNRVYYKNVGIREMICTRPSGFSQNAFVPNHPDLISVIDLSIKKWRSMKYGEIIILERLRQKDLNYAQRSTVAKIRGRDWDYLWPGDEGDSLRPNALDLGETKFP